MPYHVQTVSHILTQPKIIIMDEPDAAAVAGLADLAGPQAELSKTTDVLEIDTHKSGGYVEGDYVYPIYFELGSSGIEASKTGSVFSSEAHAKGGVDIGEYGPWLSDPLSTDPAIDAFEFL
ncbi:MAG: hypothetical protein AAFR46_07040 [Pseudomonadota bacterium]